jgi:signal transduction histidine kinase
MAAAHLDGTRQGAGPTGVRVLIVDDDPDLRILAGRRLERAGFAVDAVGSGEAALTRLAEQPADLVLLDYRLPGRDGLATLRLLRARGGPSVVLATGDGSEEVAVEALRAGAVDYLAKTGRFLDELPGVMERAWRAHDLARRAEELQHQALLVSSGADRSATLDGIVTGAHTLLRGLGCALFVPEEGGVALEVTAGSLPDDVAPLRRAALAALRRDEPGTPPADPPTDALLVPLANPEGTPLGVLVVLLQPGRAVDPEERRLAEALAAFGGIALANVGRFELEREMVAKLQDLVEMRRQVVTTVSHEVRTPLTCIRGFAQTLLSHGDALGAEEGRTLLEGVLAHTEALSSLAEQLVQVAEVEASRTALGLAPLDLAEVVRTTRTLLGPLLEGRGVTLELGEAVVLADAVLLQRVLANLVSNAVKYSPPGEAIALRVRPAEAGWAAVDVVDAGPGLAPNELARVFEPFWRTSGPLRDEVRGAGVGLALVREYVTLMGGRVEARSEVGAGSTFSVVLRRPT